MAFNNFLWNNYKETKSGQEMIYFFQNYETEFYLKNEKSKYVEIQKTMRYGNVSETDIENFSKIIIEAKENILEEAKNNGITTIITNLDEAGVFYEYLYSLEYAPENDGDEPEYIFSYDDVSFLSEILFLISPQFFFPYYFDRLYHDLLSIAHEFNIFIPSVPAKNDSRSRFFHYFEICKSIYQFRTQNGIDQYELPVFLYGFAINLIKRYKIYDELPEPRKAYFVGAGKKDNTVDSSEDFDYLDKALPDSVSNWNGNPDTQPGDIIVMYCLAPRSYVHSIWRAVTPGSFDPFFHYYKNVNIGRPLFVTPITLDEIKKDNVLSELPLVKANMQGINGRNIPKKYYDRLLELLEEKGQDVSILPKLLKNEIETPELANERDIEERLLEPLLLKLGYKKSDWKRQMRLRMGRGDRVYPDYVIFPNEERNNESCYWIWEAKFTIGSHKQLEEDFGQAKSYALRLKSAGFCLVSKEGLWLSMPDFSIEKIKFWSWSQIADHDTLSEIFDIAGNRKTMRKNAQ